MAFTLIISTLQIKCLKRSQWRKCLLPLKKLVTTISLNFADGISVNADHLIYDAKQVALALYENGYKAPKREKIPVTGDSGYATMLLGAEGMFLSGFISEHDLKIAKKLAFVLAGGKVPYGTLVDEQYLLDLEREAFLSLVAEPKSQQRMQHMLVKGKPLRN